MQAGVIVIVQLEPVDPYVTLPTMYSLAKRQSFRMSAFAQWRLATLPARSRLPNRMRRPISDLFLRISLQQIEGAL